MSVEISLRLAAEARPDNPHSLARDILQGFARVPRRIPSLYFYDEAGCAIYDEITRLDEYYPPRVESAILQRRAPEMVARCGPCEWVELGAGSATRTRILLSEAARAFGHFEFTPTDASLAMLGRTVEELRKEYPGARIDGILGDFERTLERLDPRADRTIVFLGGTVGNLTDGEIRALAARAIRALGPGGHFLVGFDRQEHRAKPVEIIHRAYNDAAGVTARFNLNLLVRLNRELGADFDLSRWSHDAPYVPKLHRIEMHLVSACEQTVRIAALERSYRFGAGERILTEISRKFTASRLARLFAPLELETSWTDEEGLFGVALLRRP